MGDRLALYLDLVRTIVRYRFITGPSCFAPRPHPGFDDMPVWGTQ